MTTDLASLFAGLIDAGFVAADATIVSDRPIANFTYWTRVHEGQPQYVGLCCAHDEPRFLEATVDVFATTRNPRAKGATHADKQRRGGAPIFSNIARNLETLVVMISRVYLVPSEKFKTPLK